MRSDTVILLKTHLLNKQVIGEYLKLKKTGSRVILFVDNRNGILDNFPSKEGHITLYGVECEVFGADQKHYDSLNLPYYYRDKSIDFGQKLLWSNVDYALYVAAAQYPEYTFIFQIEYDVYYNGADYSLFLDQFDKSEDDLLILCLMPVTQNWSWGKANTDWIYKDYVKWQSFTPVLRISNKACGFLAEKRRSHAKKFELELLNPTCGPKPEWPFCELFMPTELQNNGFSCRNITARGCIYHRENHPDFLSRRLYLAPDNQLYHPVKDSFFIEELEQI